jgi:hypothetical protein
MLDRLNQVSVGADLPDFVTTTLPDDCFDDDIGRFSQAAKLHLSVLLKRLRRACASASGFWRIEWKARKSGAHIGKLFPHFHLLVWGLPQRVVEPFSRNGVADVLESFVPVRDAQQKFDLFADKVWAEHSFEKPGSRDRFGIRWARNRMRVHDHLGVERERDVNTWLSFADWISMAWYHVVGTGNLDHFLAGCRVEKLRSWGGVVSYCAKYMSKSDSENFLSDISFGRSWGIFNRAYIPWAKMIELPLDEDAGIRLRRVMRRYLEHQRGCRVQRHWGVTIYCDVKQFSRLLAREPDAPF